LGNLATESGKILRDAGFVLRVISDKLRFLAKKCKRYSLVSTVESTINIIYTDLLLVLSKVVITAILKFFSIPQCQS